MQIFVVEEVTLLHTLWKVSVENVNEVQLPVRQLRGSSATGSVVKMPL